MKRLLGAVVLLALLLAGAVCQAAEAPAAPDKRARVQIYIEGSVKWEKNTLAELKGAIEAKLPPARFELLMPTGEMAGRVNLYKDESKFFRGGKNKTLLLRTEDWKRLTKQADYDYVLYCRLVRSSKKHTENFLTKTRTNKVEMDCHLRIFNVARGEYTYVTEYRTVGKAHNTKNYERAERHAVMAAFRESGINPDSL